MKKTISIVALILMCISLLAGASAAGARIEEVEYKGFGIVKVDFTKDCAWYPDAQFSMTDMNGSPVEAAVIGGEEDEAYLFIRDLPENVVYNLIFSLGEVNQELSFTAVTGTEYRFTADGVTAIVDMERCDYCGEAGHDDDFCPKAFANIELPEDPALLAKLFDIDPLPVR